MSVKSFLIKLYLFLSIVTSYVGAKSNYGVIHQYGLLDDVLHGQYTPIASVKDIAMNNDFGIGAGVGLGELIIINGNFYLASPQGKLQKLNNSDTVSFATTTKFTDVKDLEFRVNNIKNFNQFIQIIEKKIVNKNLIYAIEVTGYFDKLGARSEDIDHVPYTPIVSWMRQHQHSFNCDNQVSTIVMFRTPANLSDVEVTYHAHFVNEARTMGGHVFEFTTSHNLQVKIIPIDQINIILRKQFAQVVDSKDGVQKDAFLHIVESGGIK